MLIDSDLVTLWKCYVYGVEVKVLLCCSVLMTGREGADGGVKSFSEAPRLR